MPDFIPDHIGNRDVLVLGMNPSSNTRPLKNGTFARLQTWMDSVGIPHWDFHNVVPHKLGDVRIDDVPWDVLKAWIGERKVIICLGNFVAKVIKNVDVGQATVILVDHPSPRNRKFNDPAYEPKMLKELKEKLCNYLKTPGSGESASSGPSD